MNLLSLQLWNFMRHEQTLLKFPERGVVLVTGHNGAGKSSIIEGVAYGGWGETLRGASPIADEKKLCEVFLATAHVHISRHRKGAKAKLDWSGPEPESHASLSPEPSKAADYETPTKAQEALEHIIGSFDVWRYTHVFSSADAARFTEATDKERKLLLEAMIGLVRFDEALEKARVELRTAEKALGSAEAALRVAEAGCVNAQVRKNDAAETLTRLGGDADITAVEEKRRHLREVIEKTEKEIAAAHERIAAARGDSSAVAVEIAALSRRLNKLGTSGICDSCGQEIPKALREGLRSAFDARNNAKLAEEKRASEATEDLRGELADATETVQRLRRKEGELAGQITAHRRTAEARAAAARALKEAEQQRAEAEQQIEACVLKVQGAKREAAIGAAVEQVLGFRGVRAQLLSRMLKGMESAANMWLARISPNAGLKVELKSYSEKKAGGVTDAISLTVAGAGGGHGYRAASGGERRRIDLALLLAFAGRGTLFFDEVFDALDEDGADAVAIVLAELAKDRCVVVISHNPARLSRVPHVVVWKVEDGRLARSESERAQESMKRLGAA